MNYKSIFTPYVARNLLRMGNPIFDIKPDKNNSSKTIFIFEGKELTYSVEDVFNI